MKSIKYSVWLILLEPVLSNCTCFMDQNITCNCELYKPDCIENMGEFPEAK